jgi:hypothetical protein
MDPQTCLEEVLVALAHEGSHIGPPDDDDRAYLVEHLRALADWLDGGGWVPVIPPVEAYSFEEP